MIAYRVHPEARGELDAIAERYETERPGLGAEFLEDYATKLEQALGFPRSGPIWAAHETCEIRRFVLSRFPFTLVMAWLPEAPTVVAVAHQRRRPGYWRGRIE